MVIRVTEMWMEADLEMEKEELGVKDFFCHHSLRCECN